MENYKWIDGFAIASKLYYKFGNLDIDTGIVTNKGFPIGEWLQWNRDNIGSLSVYDINDLTSMGMIWNRSLLGHHKDFNKNLERLKKYKRLDDKIILSMIEEEDLKEWAYNLIEWRKLENNAFLTLREVDMLDEIGFSWGNQFNKTRAQEENARKIKMEYLVDQLRLAYTNNTRIVYREKEDNTRLKEKVENVKRNLESKDTKTIIKRVEVPVRSVNWYDILLSNYMEKHIASDEAVSVYKSTLEKGKNLGVRELEFLQFLNGGKPGISDYFIKRRPYTDIPSLSITISELGHWVDTLNALKSDIVWDNTQYTVNGYNVASLVYKLLIEFELIGASGYDISNRLILDYIVKPYGELKRKSPVKFIGKVFTFEDRNTRNNSGVPQLEDFQKMYDKKKSSEAEEKKLIREKEKQAEKERRAELKAQMQKEKIEHKQLRDQMKNDLDERQRKEREALESKHKLERENLITQTSADKQEERKRVCRRKKEINKESEKSTYNRKRKEIINFSVPANITKSVTFLKNYMLAYGYVPFVESEVEDEEVKRVIRSLHHYGAESLDDKVLNRFERYGFFFFDGEITEEVHQLRIAYCKMMKAMLDGVYVYAESETFRTLSTHFYSPKYEMVKDSIQNQMYTEADSVYKDLPEFKAIAEKLAKAPETSKLVEKMVNSMIYRICSKRYSNKIR